MMITTQPFPGALNQVSAVIRALSSITSQQVDTIAQAIQASGRAWGMQTIDDYDGYLSILIEPSVRDDEQKTLFISGTAQHLDLFEGYGDDMRSVATFNDVEELSARLLDPIGQQ